MSLTKLFGKEEVNVSRQFEFDFAKAVCILGMVFVHCFEELTPDSAAGTGALYYIIVTVLDAVFGAGTFMLCMGLGIAYSWKENANKLIRRGCVIFVLAYVLNAVRDGLPRLLLIPSGVRTVESLTDGFLCVDIMMFAGLALLLFGLLKKAKVSDLWLLIISLAMSAVGSFVRFIDCGSTLWNELAGLFIGTYSETDPDVYACFPLLNWFCVVVIGYLYAKALRRCRDLHRYYTIAFPVSALFLAVYLAVTIPGGIGLMNSDILYYYQFTTPEVAVLFFGMVFATGLYHFISLPFSDRPKRIITRISSNINRIYCIHWILVCWISYVFEVFYYDGMQDGMTVVTAIVIFAVSVLLAEFYTRCRENKRLKKNP